MNGVYIKTPTVRDLAIIIQEVGADHETRHRITTVTLMTDDDSTIAIELTQPALFRLAQALVTHIRDNRLNTLVLRGSSSAQTFDLKDDPIPISLAGFGHVRFGKK